MFVITRNSLEAHEMLTRSAQRAKWPKHLSPRAFVCRRACWDRAVLRVRAERKRAGRARSMRSVTRWAGRDCEWKRGGRRGGENNANRKGGGQSESGRGGASGVEAGMLGGVGGDMQMSPGENGER